MKLIILVRSILATIFFPFTVLILGPVAMVLHFIFFNKKIDDRIIMFWGSLCCRMCGVRVEVEGLKNIPQSGCLFLFNHSSFFDVFALAGYMPGLRFGAKAELFDIPIFGQTMKAMGTLPIARNNREEVYKIYDDAKSRFEHGEKFALAPEGGRFYNPKSLFPFKAGPFIFAMSAEAPLVPVVILGANECLPKGSFLFNKNRWSQTIYLKILPQIETVGFSPSNRRELQKIVFDRMNPIWVEYNEKLKQPSVK